MTRNVALALLLGCASSEPASDTDGATSSGDGTSNASTSNASTSSTSTTGTDDTTIATTADSSSTDPSTTTAPESGTGLEFPPNFLDGSDARLEWSGADMLDRTSHTAIWQARYVQQNGYYAVAWHTSNDGTWHASLFEYGTHPYPTTGTVDASGQSTGGTGGEGAVHYYEIAGLGASDFIASPGPGPTYLLGTDVWVTQARTAELVGDEVRHRYWPDLADPDAFIEQSVSADGVAQASAAAVSPAFTIGGSPWTGDGSGNGESPAAVLRGFAFFSSALAIDDLVAEANSASDAPVTDAGAASVWYINRNPTPDDVADRSGAGHSPVWANDARPGLWTAP
ncbi:MAG TPA: hypothetical protein VG755_43195 [Nannocystaceae bacterium]|nr:hypothetical protein [Nannocystaceae bacterium]